MIAPAVARIVADAVTGAAPDEALGILDRAIAIQDDAAIVGSSHTHGKISFRSSTSSTAPSPNSVVPE